MNSNIMSLIDNLVNTYKDERKKHIKEQWLTSSRVIGRIRGKHKTYNDLRNADICFFESIQLVISDLLNNSLVTTPDIERIVVILKNHRSILAERDFYLIFYAAILAVFLLVPRNELIAWGMVFVATFFGILAFIERWNMKQHDLIYNELIELLQYESKQRT